MSNADEPRRPRGAGPDELRFEVEDDYDESPRRVPKPPVEEPVDDDGVSRTDPAGLVTVTVDAAGGIKSVKLTHQWQHSVAPEALHQNVLLAANAAIMAALAQVDVNAQAAFPWAVPTQAEAIRPAGQPVPQREPRSPQDRITASAEVVRLVDTVVAELAQFDQKLSAARERPASVQSNGQHVRVTADNIRILGVSIDPAWLTSTRNPDIERELVDALVQAQHQASLGSLAQGPQSPATSELMRLVSNPAELLRRLGLT